MTANQDLIIYDIGAHVGEDTAWYLHEGFRVVAVEANPVYAEALRKKFSDAISKNRLQVVQAAVSASASAELEFHVAEETGLSSLHNHRLDNVGWKYVTIHVPAISLQQLFATYGRGLYCKIDIEGEDIPVVKSLRNNDSLPNYLSVEITGLSLEELQGNPEPLLPVLDDFVRIGYTRFKLVDQYTLKSLSLKSYYRWQRNLLVRAGRKILKTFGIFPYGLLTRQWYCRKYGFQFTENGSGPFGEMIRGEWYDAKTMRRIIRERFVEFDRSDPVRHHIFWVDLHAKK